MLISDSSFLPAILGGVCIGLASLLAAGATGKIPGISGVLALVLRPRRGDTAWRVAFLLGLVVGAGLAFWSSESAAMYRPARSVAWFAVAGLLVGFGARLGGGCTSGHGVCGIGMGSPSALFATLVFMAAGMGAVFAVQRLM